MKGLSYPPSSRRGKKVTSRATYIPFYSSDQHYTTPTLSTSRKPNWETHGPESELEAVRPGLAVAATYVNFDICNLLISHKKGLTIIAKRDI